MKKVIISLLLLFSLGLVKANPISLPPVISEFYLVNDSTWYLELFFDPVYYPDTTLDGYQIITSTDTVQFFNGIHFLSGNIVVITQDSMQHHLSVHRTGDFIRIEKDGMYIDEIGFGNNMYSMIDSPFPGQSIVNYAYGCFDTFNMQPATYYKPVKENIPSIGLNPFQASVYMGNFTGKVFDLNHNPITGIKIGNPANYYEPSGTCNVEFTGLTDSSGGFNFYIRSGRHYVRIYTLSAILLDTAVNIEPDSVNYYEFVLDTLLNRITFNSIYHNYLLSCYPNPSNGRTTITFDLQKNIQDLNPLIKIYNSTGEIIKILPIDFSGKERKYSVEWDGKSYDNSVASGVYYYNLELDGKKVATNKLVITK